VLDLIGCIGSGKSWAVALLRERAAHLKSAIIIVFDMQGEYLIQINARKL